MRERPEMRGHLEMTPQDEQLARLLRRCGKILYYQSNDATRQKMALKLLENGPMTQRQVQERLEINPASASELISKLEDKDLLVRQRCPEDRRMVLLTLTEKGERHCRAHPGHPPQGEGERRHAHPDHPARSLFAPLTQEERQELIVLLEKMLNQEREGERPCD